MEILMNVNQSLAVAEGMSEKIQKLNGCYSDIWRVISKCPLKGEARRYVIFHLKAIAKNIQNETIALRTMKKVLEESISAYRTYENTVIGNVRSVANVEGENTLQGGWKTSDKGSGTLQLSWSDLIYKIVGKCGPAAGVNVVTAWFRKEDKIEAGIDSTKALNSVIGSFAGMVNGLQTKGNQAKWYELLFGLNVDKNAPKTFGESVSKQLGKDLGFGVGNVTKANKVKIGTKWGGHLLTVGTDVYQNYKECKSGKISWQRAVMETIIQSVADVGIGVAATALASAFLAPVGPAALAVGITAVGVTWIAESACKAITQKVTGEEKGIGETMADLVCDSFA